MHNSAIFASRAMKTSPKLIKEFQAYQNNSLPRLKIRWRAVGGILSDYAKRNGSLFRPLRFFSVANKTTIW